MRDEADPSRRRTSVYLEERGRVGASWMTKEARKDDILDYVRYLDGLSAELGLTEQRPVLLGFSQGVATASRWVAMGKTAFSRLILWSGVFPPDDPWESGTEPMKAMRVDVALGTEDAFFDDSLRSSTSVLRHPGCHLRPIVFPQRHAIDTELLQRLLD